MNLYKIAHSPSRSTAFWRDVLDRLLFTQVLPANVSCAIVISSSLALAPTIQQLRKNVRLGVSKKTQEIRNENDDASQCAFQQLDLQ